MTPAKTERLRRQVAEAEATLSGLRSRLAAAEAAPAGAAPPPTGLDLLWRAALPKSRERSSQHRCRTAWNRIPQGERPPVSVLLAALSAWNRSDGWKSDGNIYAPGLHRFIAERMWEDLPESAGPPPSRYRPAPAAKAPNPPEDCPTDRAELARLLCIRVRPPVPP